MTLDKPFAAALLALALLNVPATAQTTSYRPAYGCFKVTVPELNIRETASSKGNIVATTYKNEILVKRRRFCTLRGFWCAVTISQHKPRNFSVIAFFRFDDNALKHFFNDKFHRHSLSLFAFV